MMAAKGTGGTLPAWLAGAGLILVVGDTLRLHRAAGHFSGARIGHRSRAPFANVVETLADRGAAAHDAQHRAARRRRWSRASALLAVPLGVCRALCSAFRSRRSGTCSCCVPFMIPPYIATLGWIMTLQPRGYLSAVGGLPPRAIPVLAAAASTSSWPSTPFRSSISPCRARSRPSAPATPTSPGVFGATPARAFWRVTLPLAAPGLAASLLLGLCHGNRGVRHAGGARPPSRLRGAGQRYRSARLRLADRPAGRGDHSRSCSCFCPSSPSCCSVAFLPAGPSRRPAASRTTRTSGRWARSPLPVVAALCARRLPRDGRSAAGDAGDALSQKTISGGLVPGQSRTAEFPARSSPTPRAACMRSASALRWASPRRCIAGLLGALSAYVRGQDTDPGAAG